MKILCIIPARYASTRFPGKPLVDIAGKSMIQRVYEQTLKCKAILKTIVATDDQRIIDHVSTFGGEVMMTGDHHASGTDRCNEVVQHVHDQYDYVINVQGDEPFIDPEQIEQLANLLDGETEIATLIKKISDPQMLFSEHVVKCVVSVKYEALYFSRHPIPFYRNLPKEEWVNKHTYYKHLGLYAYRTDVLSHLSSLSQSPLEKSESLEQLRWLENGFGIRVGITSKESIGIDTPEDLKRLL